MRCENKIHLQFPQDTVPHIWIEAIGFFASKLINNRRKFAFLEDLPSHHHVTLIALEERLHEQMALKTGKPLKSVRRNRYRKYLDYYEASRVVGAILGNRIYTAYQKNNLDHVKLHRWLKTPVSNSPRFLRFYISVLEDLKKVQVLERSKNERL